MLTVEQYKQLVLQTNLTVTSISYEHGHYLPEWYPTFEAFTPYSLWLKKADLSTATIKELLQRMPAGPAIVKDYVKSMKHKWHEACFIENTRATDTALQVINTFMSLRDSELDGGLVLRQFEPFLQPEIRTWWINNQCVLQTPHPDSPNHATNVDVRFLQKAVEKLAAGFITIDLARNHNNSWRVIEIGDGQVSGLPSSVAPALLLQALLTAA